MRKSRFPDQQIHGIVREVEAGANVADVCRRHGVSTSALQRWHAKYRGLELSQAKRLKVLDDENRRLKRLVADHATSARAQVGVQCGPPADVVVTPPRGPAASVPAALLGGNGAFTCELGPHHFVDALDTRTAVLKWRAPAARGTYEARAGLRRGGGLGNLSDAARVTVQ
jgi:putative transposase